MGRVDYSRSRALIAIITLLWSIQGKVIRFTAKQRHTSKLASPDFTRFCSFWNENDALSLIKCNPGLLEVSARGANSAIARLAPLEFPGLKIFSEVVFETERSNNGNIRVSCTPASGGLKQTFEGSSFVCNLVSKLKPIVTSTNICGVDEESMSVFTEADLTIQFDIAPWFPISGELLEKGGSAAIGAGVEKDLKTFLQNLVQSFFEQQGAAGLTSNPITAITAKSSNRMLL